MRHGVSHDDEPAAPQRSLLPRRRAADGDRAASGVATTFQGFDPSDPEAALDQLRTARVTLGDLHDEAPDEVRDDLQVEIDYVQALIDALEQVEPGRRHRGGASRCRR